MTTFYWHLHHDILCEPALEPIENRIDYIKNYKPSNEIDTRLKLLKPVKGVLPEAFVKAWEVYVKAREAHIKAGEAYDKAGEAYAEARKAYVKAWEACAEAGEAYDKAWEAYAEAGEAHIKARKASALEIESLHKIECPDCPWTGTTIFSGK